VEKRKGNEDYNIATAEMQRAEAEFRAPWLHGNRRNR
jgi:hypothetical protein